MAAPMSFIRSAAPVLREGGVYWITGGQGGTGYLIVYTM